MTRTPGTTATAAAIVATTLLAITGCTGGSGEDRSEIDARSYYEDYEAGATDGQTLMATAQKDAAVAPESSPSGGDSIITCDDCRPQPPIPPVTGQNVFHDAGTNPVLDPSKQPTSTFGLDVDTGSYRIANHFLERNTMPPPESVRPEEWINAFEYAGDAPAGSDLGVSSDIGASPTSSTQLLRVAVSSRDLDDGERPPASLTFVVDTSGSMDIRNRLGLVKSSLALLAKNLRPDDEIGIVTYDDRARGILEPTPVSQTGEILDAIDELEPGGGTNLEAGVRLGYEYAADAADESGTNAVILASDGVANIGLTNPDGLARQVNTAATEQDVHLVTVGYGMGNYNDDLMEQLADQGQGLYSYVSTFEDAQRLFSDELTSTLGVVAEDAKAQVEFDPASVRSYRLIGYENRALSDAAFDDASVDAGEIGPGMDVSALYEVTPTGEAGSGTTLGTATVRWRSASDGSQQQATTTLRMPGISAEPSDELRMASTVGRFAEIVKHHQGAEDLDAMLRSLQSDAAELAADDVAGADDLRGLIADALDARPADTTPYGVR